MQSRVRNVGPWEMKHKEATLLSSWNLAAFDLGDGSKISNSQQHSPKSGE